MKDCIYQTDPAWMESLRKTATRENVNFWRKDRRRMKLRPGAYFYFKKRGSHSVMGRGRLVRSEFKTVSDAWDVFGLGNGAPTLGYLESQVSSVLGLEDSGNAEIQCMMLENIEWLPRSYAYELSENEFPGNVMAMKYFERGEFPGLEGMFKPENDAEPVRRRSQGRGLSPGKRKAIEEWAVRLATKRFPELDLQDVGLTKSWDLEDDTSGESSMPVRIEVKGSTLQLDKITLTDNEVEHAKKARDEGICRLILVVVEKIELDAVDGEDKWIASGGEVRVFDPWVIDDGGLEPTQWRYRL